MTPSTLLPEQIREVRIGLRAVKRCEGCSRTLLVSQFPHYGDEVCTECEFAEAARQEAAREAARRAVEEAERAERERTAAALRAEINTTTECACGIAKPRTQPRCRWCQARQRMGVVEGARQAIA